MMIVFPKPKSRRKERIEQRKQDRLAYGTARGEYLLTLAREQERLRVTDLEFERLMRTPRSSLQELSKDQWPTCEMRLQETSCDVKARRATDIHHKRGRLGSDLTDQTRFVGCCRACHDYVERNRRFAIQSGWSEPRNRRES